MIDSKGAPTRVLRMAPPICPAPTLVDRGHCQRIPWAAVCFGTALLQHMLLRAYALALSLRPKQTRTQPTVRAAPICDYIVLRCCVPMLTFLTQQTRLPPCFPLLLAPRAVLCN